MIAWYGERGLATLFILSMHVDKEDRSVSPNFQTIATHLQQGRSICYCTPTFFVITMSVPERQLC